MKNLGFGMMRLPVLSGSTDFDYEQLNRMVDAFLEAGYTYFDTSFVYHNGKSEEVTRKALVERHPRDSFTVATKFPTFMLIPEEKIEETFRSQLDNLGVDYIDYYLLHNIQTVYYDGYDGKGSSFGDTLVSCESDNIEASTAYASINGDNTDVVTLVITNKAFADKTTANITLDSEYSYAHLYGITDMAAEVFDMTDQNPAVKINGKTVTYEMEPRTVSLLVLAKDKSALEKKNGQKASSSQAEQSEKKSNLPLIGGIAGGAALLAGGAVMLARKKKKG